MLIRCDRFKAIREEKLISREKLADEIGYSVSRIYQIESKKTVKMKIHTLKAVCKVFKVDVSELVVNDAA
jgi:transcriptional regulator with XRE-family HTH domain